ncbi:MAG: trigger factor [Anaerolineales bacterium]
MKVETQDKEDRQVELTVEVPGDRLQTAMHMAARALSKQTRIAGFRPGKAPYEVILRRFGEEAVFEEALETLGQEAYRQAIEQASLEPYAPGSLDEVVTRDPLVLRYTVPLAPEVKLGKYKKLRLPFDPPEVQDQAVDALMEELRHSQALIEPADRPSEIGDVVLLDLTGKLRNPPEGENATLVNRQGVSVLVSEDTDWPFAGIAEHLVGLEAGQEKQISHTFPDDYANESLRSQEADFQLTCLEVKSRLVPEWTDDLARNVGDFEDLLDLRIKVRQRLQEEAEKKAEAEYAERVVGAHVEQAKVSHPPLLLEHELDEMLQDMNRRLQAQNLSLEDYLKIEKRTFQDLRSELEPRAKERVERALVLTELVRTEELEVSDEELQAEIDRLIAPFGDEAEKVRQAFDSPAGRRRVTMDLLAEKAVKWLVALARGEAETDPKTDKKAKGAKPKAKKKRQEKA